MTSTSSLFHSYTPCADNQEVKILDGSLSFIADKGSIKISDHINLKSVLHVPNLSCNLLSVIKLSNDSNCFVVFYPNKYEFQDLGLGRTFGSATMQDGLYYFVDNLSSNNSVLDLACSVSSLLVRTQVMMWHFRLGHPSFSYLKHLFPSLFEKTSSKDLHCDICCCSKLSTFANCQHFFSTTINHPLLLNHNSLVVVDWHLLGCTWVAAKTLLSCINGDRDERVHDVIYRECSVSASVQKKIVQL